MTVQTLPIGLSRDEKHVYYWNDGIVEWQALPSVTTILGATIAKQGLTDWAAGLAAEWCAGNLETLHRMVMDFGVQGTVQAVKTRSRAVRDEKAGVGSRVHELAEQMLRGTPLLPELVEPESWPYVEKLGEWIRRKDPKLVAAEEMVVNLAYGYAGTFDAILRIDGATWMVDIKTGARIYPETALQLVAYAHGEIGRPGTLERLPMRRIDRYGVLHLTADHCELVPYNVTASTFEGFLAAVDLHYWITNDAKSIIERKPRNGR